ncbi:hypothetical protein ED21_31974 [Erythrobacter sp. SD-21]|nr:hypothetical protein ED21_31974 [Erythrobacter sp. SD-21]
MIQLAANSDGAVPSNLHDVKATELCEALRDSAMWAVLETMGQVETKFLVRSQHEVRVEAFKVIDCLADAWRLSRKELLSILGLDSGKDLTSLRTHTIADLDPVLVDRVSGLIEIFGAINILLPIATRADEWMRAANKAPLFNGRSALELMADGNAESIHAVRGYLFAQLAGP